jgi:hypothetical protein
MAREYPPGLRVVRSQEQRGVDHLALQWEER